MYTLQPALTGAQTEHPGIRLEARMASVILGCPTQNGTVGRYAHVVEIHCQTLQDALPPCHNLFKFPAIYLSFVHAIPYQLLSDRLRCYNIPSFLPIVDGEVAYFKKLFSNH